MVLDFKVSEKMYHEICNYPCRFGFRADGEGIVIFKKRLNTSGYIGRVAGRMPNVSDSQIGQISKQVPAALSRQEARTP